MAFVKNLMGGVIILIVATVIGVAQNAIRRDGIPLFARIAQPARAQQTDKTGAKTPQPAVDATMDSAAVDPSPTVTAAELTAGKISKQRVRIVMDAGNAILIDARDAGEYAEGHLPGAINIPYDNFVDYQHILDERVPYDATIIVYCTSKTCDLGEKLIRELRLMDYQHVVLYPGGWDAWSEAGYPSETSDPTD